MNAKNLPLLAWAIARALDPEADDVDPAFERAYAVTLQQLRHDGSDRKWILIDEDIDRELARLSDTPHTDHEMQLIRAFMDVGGGEAYTTAKVTIGNAGFWTGVGVACAMLLERKGGGR